MSENEIWLRVMQNLWCSRNLPWLMDLRNYFETIDVFRIVGAMAHVGFHSERQHLLQHNHRTTITNWDQGEITIFLIYIQGIFLVIQRATYCLQNETDATRSVMYREIIEMLEAGRSGDDQIRARRFTEYMTGTYFLFPILELFFSNGRTRYVESSFSS